MSARIEKLIAEYPDMVRDILASGNARAKAACESGTGPHITT